MSRRQRDLEKRTGPERGDGRRSVGLEPFVEHDAIARAFVRVARPRAVQADRPSLVGVALDPCRDARVGHRLAVLRSLEQSEVVPRQAAGVEEGGIQPQAVHVEHQ
ncbi:MAG: hypothetical protein DMF51_07565 [Acidobacteria bacterium]|nr:MAG: hypothetical protein DMF51_07565 [Acidobacteriota bacterium]